MKLFISSLLLILFFVGCSFKNSTTPYSYNKDRTFPNKSSYNYQIGKNIDYNTIYESLLSQYKEWKGVRYKYGGYSKKGVDCSAFVQRTFNEKLKHFIPRTTKLQSQTGYEVKMQDIEIGDLVFFKTSFKVRHVGIYIGEGKFLHASTKRGVTISRLDNPYYESHFWKIQRVIN